MTFAIRTTNHGTRSLQANIAGCEANTYHNKPIAYFKIGRKIAEIDT